MQVQPEPARRAPSSGANRAIIVAFNIEVSNKCRVKIVGKINTEAAEPVGFDFSLLMTRKDIDEFRADQASGALTDLRVWLTDLVLGWDGVKDAQGEPVAFSADALARVLRLPGMPMLIYRSYADQAGAMEKN